MGCQVALLGGRSEHVFLGGLSQGAAFYCGFPSISHPKKGREMDRWNGYPPVIKHGRLENPLEMEVSIGKSLNHKPLYNYIVYFHVFSIAMFDYRRVGGEIYGTSACDYFNSWRFRCKLSGIFSLAATGGFCKWDPVGKCLRIWMKFRQTITNL